MRIIAEKGSSGLWVAWWADVPERRETSANIYGAVAKLVIHSPDGQISINDLVMDYGESRVDHVEFSVVRQPRKETQE